MNRLVQIAQFDKTGKVWSGDRESELAMNIHFSGGSQDSYLVNDLNNLFESTW